MYKILYIEEARYLIHGITNEDVIYPTKQDAEIAVFTHGYKVIRIDNTYFMSNNFPELFEIVEVANV